MAVILLFITGFLVRIYNISNFPPVDIDEFGIAYNAYSILHYGVDEWGVRMPLFFKSFGDFKLPLDIYLVAFFYKFIGQNILSLRLPAVLFGALYIPVIYLLLRAVLKDKRLCLLGALIMTFSPYNLFFSRVISASISQSFFIMASVTAFIYYLKYNRNLFLYLFTFLLSLSLYSYPASWIVAPLLFFSYLVIAFIRNRQNKHYIIIIILFGLSLIPIAKQYFAGGSTVRVKNVSFLGAERGVVMEIDEFRAHDGNTLFAKILHNKAIHYAYVFSHNYAKHFDFSYLLLGKYELIPQHSLDPPIYAVLIPFYYIGLFYLITKRSWTGVVILLWILISPIPSAITEGAVNSKRYLSFMGSETVVALMAFEMLKVHKKKILYTFILVILGVQISFLASHFYTTFARLSEDYIYFKANVLHDVVRDNNKKVDTFVYTFESLGEPQIYPLVATNYSPVVFNKIKKYSYEHLYVIEPFDKFYYSKNLKDIENRITIDVTAGKRVMGLFSGEEKNKLSDFCFKIEKQYPMPITKRIYYLVIFNQCK